MFNKDQKLQFFELFGQKKDISFYINYTKINMRFVNVNGYIILALNFEDNSHQKEIAQLISKNEILEQIIPELHSKIYLSYSNLIALYNKFSQGFAEVCNNEHMLKSEGLSNSCGEFQFKYFSL